MEWRAVAALIAPIERREALQSHLRVAGVVTNAKNLPTADKKTGAVLHIGVFGSWKLEAGQLEAPLVAVLRLSSGRVIGVDAAGNEHGVEAA